ncbi:serine/threonine-protein kinase RIO3 isoform X2 [Aplysia californica]|nr:serine/threonine-protein kinase RIO3 isoform X2 [Aplysia californica]XP_005105596.1 serine/threonine-protein kinase RIO3 isoform X2 [Aplysia californica]
MSSPWGKTASCAPVPCSLEDVMSEQLASDLETQQVKEEWEQIPESVEATPELSDVAAASTDSGLSDAELAAKLAAEEAGGDPNDELLARYLQKQFDEEYDAMVAQKEKKYNGTSKVSISFENYKMKHRRDQDGNQLLDDDDDAYDEDFPEVPQPTSWETNKPVIGTKGYSGQGKNIVTKHDKVICGRRNAERLMDMPPGFEIGDGEGMDMQLPNRVYNKLKNHSMSEAKRSHKVHEKKDHSTAIKAVDEKTRMVLFKLVNSGYLASISGEVSQGKEAVVLKSIGGMKDDEELPGHIILKVYKTTMLDFHTRAKYVYGDHVLSKDKLKKQNPRKIIKLWAEKEFLNLKRMQRHSLPCPTPLTLKKNVLVMSCVGGEVPAPKLKEVRLSTEDYQDAYEQVVQLMKKMYHQCGLVHADLSEYNLLWHDDKVWVIDVSQSVERENANSYEFLLRDCQNVCNFFKQVGVHGVGSAEDLFMEITNMSLEGQGKVFTSQVQRYDKDNYSFDYFFDQSEATRAQCLGSDDSSESEDEGEATEGAENVGGKGVDETVASSAQTRRAKNEQDTSSSAQTSTTSSSSADRWVIDSADCS